MLRALIQAMRPRQWTKNVFVLAAVVFDRQLPNPVDVLARGQWQQLEPLLRSLAAFALFCLISSSVYLINDIKDVESDRRHPTKRLRPIASGRLPVSAAWIGAFALIAFTLPVSNLLAPEFAAVVLVYLIVNLAYSNWLKHVPLVDVLVLAAGFVLRVAAGVLALESVQRFSPWLYVAVTMLALYMGFGKRRSELALMAGDGASSRKVLDGYTLPLLDQLILIVSSTTIITYSLYTFSAPNVPDNHTMMLTIPFVLYAIFRYLYLIQVKQAGGAPEELLLSDRPLQIAVALWGLSVLLIFYIF
jgi:4-hydroxybenzoate polyprenyltransferase